MLQDLVFVPMVIEVADADYAGGGAHVRGAETAEVLKAFPAVDHVVCLSFIGRFPFLLVVFGELDVIAQTDVGDEHLFEVESCHIHSSKSISLELLQPPILDNSIYTSFSLSLSFQASTFSGADWIQLRDMFYSELICISENNEFSASFQPG